MTDPVEEEVVVSEPSNTHGPSSSLGVDTEKNPNEPSKSKSPTKAKMTQRLTAGFHTVTDKSKDVLHSAAQTAGSLSKKTATSAVTTLKHGVQMATAPFKEHKEVTDDLDGSEKKVMEIENKKDITIEAMPLPVPKEEVSSNNPDTTGSHRSLIFSHLNHSSSSNSLQGVKLNEDRMVLWVVVVSIAIVQTMQNFNSINIHDNMIPFSIVWTWMLVAFTAGMEVDGTILIQEIKYRVLGPKLVNNDEQPISMEPMESTTNVWITPVETTSRGRNPVRFLQRIAPPPSTRKPHTCLERSATSQDQVCRTMRFDALFAHRLRQFGRKKSKMGVSVSIETTSTTMTTSTTTTTTMPATTEKESDVFGRVDLEQSRATVLLTKMEAQPLCRLRGVDIFLTDCAECEMSTHPFLLRNGLRSVPTFMMNMMTQWGSILVYLELPDWVVDTSTSLVEKDDDPDNVKALKRFLAGTDDYRRDRLKIIPELIEAPYAIRLLTTKDAELQIHYDGWLETKYFSHHDDNGCPLWEVNIDFLGNSAIRSMASLVKRCLTGIKADFALVISNPDEPEAILGLWRFDHVNVSHYPTLPDRFDAVEESADVARAYELVQTVSQRRLVMTST